MSFVNIITKRGISTTAICYGKRNFKKFSIYGKRGTRIFKQQQHENPDPELPDNSKCLKKTSFAVLFIMYL